MFRSCLGGAGNRSVMGDLDVGDMHQQREKWLSPYTRCNPTDSVGCPD